jgi:hypothetical protein
MGRTLQLGNTQIDEAALAELCRRHRVRELSVFGSAARDEVRPNSDIDLLVEFLPDAEADLLDHAALMLDLARLLERHRNSGAAATVAVYPERRASGEHMPRIPVGVYIFEGHALRSVPRRGFRDIKEHLIPALVRTGERVATYEGSGMTLRVWNEQTYLATNEAVMASMASSDAAPEGYRRRGDAWIHVDASVADDVVLAGPILIAPGAMVRPKAVLIGPTSIGLDVTVGAGALVSRSAVWRRSNIRAGAMVDRAVIADDSVV